MTSRTAYEAKAAARPSPGAKNENGGATAAVLLVVENAVT